MNGRREVYFARCLTPFGTPMGAIKIGCSYGHDRRLLSIAANQPYGLELLGSVPGDLITEATIHLYLSKQRIAGEFFHENCVVMDFVENAVARSRAFQFINDGGGSEVFPEAALAAFLTYHGITLEAVCEYLERDPALYRGKLSWTKNRRLIGAALIVAQRADGPCGRYVTWPGDCIYGLLGQFHSNVLPKLPAPEIKAAA